MCTELDAIVDSPVHMWDRELSARERASVLTCAAARTYDSRRHALQPKES